MSASDVRGELFDFDLLCTHEIAAQPCSSGFNSPRVDSRLPIFGLGKADRFSGLPLST